MNAPSPLPLLPYRLRLEHEGLLSLCLRHRSGVARFDPAQPPAEDDLAVLTWSWPEQLQGVVRAYAAGGRPRVVAPAPVCDWLAARGAPRDRLHVDGIDQDGVQVQLQPYQPIPWATPIEAARKLRSAALRPDRAAARMWTRARMPRSQPQVASLRLPDGGRLVHLALSLHAGTPAAWLDAAAARYAGADWLLLGCDYGEDEAVRQLLPRFAGRKVLVADLLGDVRRRIGMPTALLTPLVDRLREDGVDAYVLASHVTFRFE